MSVRGDYTSDMPGKPISDTDVEALLTRREPADVELLGLASVLARIDLQRPAVDVEKDAGVFSLRAATLARQAGTSSSGSVSWWGRLRPKLVTSALSVFAVIGMTGVAVASDAAAPGDPLYGIDRALERIGINDGGITERLEEAGTLADHGLTVEALKHAADAVSSRSPQAASALEEAAQAVQDGQGPNLDVAAMLTWMASTDLTGKQFGQNVAERARALGADQQGEIQQPEPGTGNSGVDPAGTEGANQANRGNGGNGNSPNGGTNGGNENPGSQGNSGNRGGSGSGNSGNPGGNGNGAPGGTPPGRADK